LFGYVPGAFTGARSEGAIGKVEAADGGTLFLDEIGDLDPASEVKFLRFLEHGTFFPVGSHEERSVSVRVVCATNRELDQAVEAGEFRRDLYYRINVGHIRIPPLRERRDEVVPLAERFLHEFAERFDKHFDAIAPEAQDVLRSAAWPGNVRELRNTIERIVLMEDGPVLRADYVAPLLATGAGAGGQAPVTPAEAPLPAEELDLDQTMLRLIERALEMHDGNQSRTARYLRITREALRYRMQKIGQTT
jgi:transcriptional regulator with PAS, ATPase and Fis domain